MTRPVLLCQGFQRAFIDPASRTFSLSASTRRGACEQLLKCARACDWTTVHSFLDTDALGPTGSASIDGFSPGRTEAYFHQRTLSAFQTTGFHEKFETLRGAPIFLISLAGIGAIAATFFDGLDHKLPIYIVLDAVADISSLGVDEQERLSAIDTLARAHGRQITTRELMSMAEIATPAGAQLATLTRK